MRKSGPVSLVMVCLIVVLFSAPAWAAVTDQAATTKADVTVGDIFRAEFCPPDGSSIMFSDLIPFSDIDPNKTFALPDGRTVGDGKSDIGIRCFSNDAATWYLKIGMTAGNIPEGKLKYWVSQPYIWTGTASVQTDGTVIPDPPAWTPIAKGSTTPIYRSGPNDTVNMPLGTLITVSFQLDPSGMTKGTYTATITYTMAVVP